MAKQSPRIAGQLCGFVRYEGYLYLLDSRLRGNDGVMDYPGGLK